MFVFFFFFFLTNFWYNRTKKYGNNETFFRSAKFLSKTFVFIIYFVLSFPPQGSNPGSVLGLVAYEFVAQNVHVEYLKMEPKF